MGMPARYKPSKRARLKTGKKAGGAATAPRAAPARIGLSMIVKDEAHVIRRCLESVRPLIDYAVISDTGSTDGTPEVIAQAFADLDLPGVVLHNPWRNFADNRNDALFHLRTVPGIDYALVIDADEQLVAEPGFSPKAFKAGMQNDLYDIEMRNGDTRYLRPSIFRNAEGFAYRAVLHEYLETPKGIRRSTVSHLYNHFRPEGARSRDPQKFHKDAAALRAALESETDPFLRSRYRFYLAQSCRDAGLVDEAIASYLARAELGFWSEEVYVSLWQAGMLMHRAGRAKEQCLAPLIRASNLIQTRAEALHAAARICREVKDFESAYFFARAGLAIPQPESGLFIDASVYRYALLDEYQVAAYWIGRHADSRRAAEQLLAEARFPADQADRIKANLASLDGK